MSYETCHFLPPSQSAQPPSGARQQEKKAQASAKGWQGSAFSPMRPVPSLSSPDSPAVVARPWVASPQSATCPTQGPRPVQDTCSQGAHGAQVPPSCSGSTEESSLGRSEGQHARDCRPTLETGRGRSEDLWKAMLLKREARTLHERYNATDGSRPQASPLPARLPSSHPVALLGASPSRPPASDQRPTAAPCVLQRGPAPLSPRLCLPQVRH